MRIMILAAIAGGILISAGSGKAQCACGTGGKKSNLEIVPIDIDRAEISAGGGAYAVKEFVDLRSNIDRSKLFGNGKGRHSKNPYYAANVPYGRYRIELQSKSGSDSFGRLIDVCQPDENNVEVPREFARVHVVPVLDDNISHVVDFDSPSTVIITKFQNSLDGTEMSDLFKKGTSADQIPYGYYDLEFLLPLGLVKREVHVFQPDVWVFSASPSYFGDAFISGPGDVVSGELKNIPVSEKPVFMIMSGIYFPYTINSIVSDAGNGDGSFSFVADNPMGEFMLYTIGKSGILDAREFSIPQKLKITIDLSHPNPPKLDDAP